ncbi:OmpA family protein [Shewanella waksmanii]|uniref:OmpA family protein n=1 Tax=Shewanella waksmanii TaxID=213783 RepID=UPI0004AE009D|nr:OmpA family protein [Shewanella waksmanii]
MELRLFISVMCCLYLSACASTVENKPVEEPKVTMSSRCLDYAVQNGEQVAGFKSVYYAKNSDVPLQNLDSNMSCIVSYLANHPEKRINVQGFTDDTGSQAYNQALAQRRAQGLVEHLVLLGASPSQLQASFRTLDGTETQQVLTKEQRAEHRRVDFYVIEG